MQDTGKPNLHLNFDSDMKTLLATCSRVLTCARLCSKKSLTWSRRAGMYSSRGMQAQGRWAHHFHGSDA